MGLNRVGAFAVVALISALITFFVMRSYGQGDSGRCDIHPHLSAAGLAAMKSNLERARNAAFAAAMADNQGKDAANKAGEDAAMDNFVYNLRGPLAEEYLRHRRALDGCF